MKRLIYLLCLVFISSIVLNSCQKMAQDAIDCLRVSELISVQSAADGNKKMKLWVTSYSSGSMQSVTWDFGDGTTATANPQSTIIHTYPSAGNYTVRATVTVDLHNGNTCGPNPEKSITVN
jgi:hypothetical protein